MVLDTDAGIDDAVALALALRSPELNVVAITTSYGNAQLESTTRNVRWLLRMMGRSDIPVVPGSAGPRTAAYAPPDTHGATGAGYAPVPALSPMAPVPSPHALANVLSRARRPLTLVTMGPLTNLSYALEQAGRSLRQTIAGHVGMFGAPDARGGSDRLADFNARVDPEATETVLRGGLTTRAVGLDAGRKFSIGETEVLRLRDAPDPVTRWLAEGLRFSVESHRRRFGLSGCYLHDVLTIGALLPGEALTFEPVEVEVGLDGSDGRDHTREAETGTDLQFASNVNAVRMRSLLARVFGNAWLTGKGVQR